MELQRAKGTRDFLPDEKILRQEVETILRTTFEQYGFSPADTPILERYDVLSSKYAGGAEILKETFTLKDQGDRELALRYDLTVPLARVVAMNPTMKMPFRRYQIGTVFRDGPLKTGRYREFVQCDVDVIGASSLKQDAELLCLAQAAFRALAIPVIIRVNNRKILDALLDASSVPSDQRTTVILTLDKLEKIGLDAVKKELADKGVGKSALDFLVKAITLKGSNGDKLVALKKLLKQQEGLEELEQVLSLAPQVTFEVSLARGLAYYTGTIFEVFAENNPISSAIAAGGRYDQMIGKFRGTGDVPAVGLSFGLDTIMDALLTLRKETKKTVTRVYVLPIKTFDESFAFAQKLRDAGIPTEIDMLDRNVSKNFDYADSMGIPYVLIIGPEELKKKKVKLRDMKSGKEELLGIQEAIKKLTK